MATTITTTTLFHRLPSTIPKLSLIWSQWERFAPQKEKEKKELFRDIVFLVGTRFKTNEDRAPSAKVATRRIEGEATPPTSLPSPHLYRHHQCKRTAELPRPLSALPCSPSLCESVSLCVFVSLARFLFVGFVGFLAFALTEHDNDESWRALFPSFLGLFAFCWASTSNVCGYGLQTNLAAGFQGVFLRASLALRTPQEWKFLRFLDSFFVINPKP